MKTFFFFLFAKHTVGMCVGGSFKVLPGFIQDSSRVLPRLFLPRYLLKAIRTRLKATFHGKVSFSNHLGTIKR